MENNKRVCESIRESGGRITRPKTTPLTNRLVNKLGRLIRDRGRSTHQYGRAVTGSPHRVSNARRVVSKWRRMNAARTRTYRGFYASTIILCNLYSIGRRAIDSGLLKCEDRAVSGSILSILSVRMRLHTCIVD